jgi:hypothetical protein
METRSRRLWVGKAFHPSGNVAFLALPCTAETLLGAAEADSAVCSGGTAAGGVSPDIEAAICILVRRSRRGTNIRAFDSYRLSASSGPSMKSLFCATLFALSLSGVGARCQCSKPEMSPVWDTNQQQFRCATRADSKDKMRDDSVSPKGVRSSVAQHATHQVDSPL